MANNKFLFTSESVSEGHPDKVADQISDAILDEILRQDPDSKVACETLVTTGLVVLSGEITTKAEIDYHKIVRDTIREIGYTKSEYGFSADSCGIQVCIHSQSPDIAMGVVKDNPEEQGAGDQGIMFGYATNETPEYLPASIAFAHRLVKELANIRKNEPGIMDYLGPDAKSQVTIEYENGKPKRVHTILISTQHDEFADDETMQKQIREDIQKYVIPRVIPENLLDENLILHVNPTGRFVIGGPHGDTGLTGRKIIVDTYGGWGAHGGGAFSGKDPSKVDRSAAYAARHIAKNLVAAGIADKVLVQISYAIGLPEPLSIFIDTYGTNKTKFSNDQIAEQIKNIYDLRPYSIIKNLDLKKPIYKSTAAYGHVGRNPEVRDVEMTLVSTMENGNTTSKQFTRKLEKVKFFPWEELNYVDKFKEIFL